MASTNGSGKTRRKKGNVNQHAKKEKRKKNRMLVHVSSLSLSFIIWQSKRRGQYKDYCSAAMTLSLIIGSITSAAHKRDQKAANKEIEVIDVMTSDSMSWTT